jgi:hypothetical protein
VKEAAVKRSKVALDATIESARHSDRRSKKHDRSHMGTINNEKINCRPFPSRTTDEDAMKSQVGVWDNPVYDYSTSPAVSNSSSVDKRQLGSPVTRQILGRQKHTRHASIDVGKSQLFSGGIPMNYGTSASSHCNNETHRASTNLDRHKLSGSSSALRKLRTIASSDNLCEGSSTDSEDESIAMSTSTLSSAEAIWDVTKSQMDAAKYVFVTLRLALLNSLVIIAVGCFGFWSIEGFSLIDSWYFTTVLLTTVGYVIFLSGTSTLQ